MATSPHLPGAKQSVGKKGAAKGTMGTSGGPKPHRGTMGTGKGSMTAKGVMGRGK